MLLLTLSHTAKVAVSRKRPRTAARAQGLLQLRQGGRPRGAGADHGRRPLLPHAGQRRRRAAAHGVHVRPPGYGAPPAQHGRRGEPARRAGRLHAAAPRGAPGAPGRLPGAVRAPALARCAVRCCHWQGGGGGIWRRCALARGASRASPEAQARTRASWRPATTRTWPQVGASGAARHCMWRAPRRPHGALACLQAPCAPWTWRRAPKRLSSCCGWSSATPPPQR